LNSKVAYFFGPSCVTYFRSCQISQPYTGWCKKTKPLSRIIIKSY